MPNTLELLAAALKKQRAAAWCRQLNITEAAMSLAKKRGRLSPTLAGNIALEMGEDAVFWTAVAAAEAEPRGPLRERLEQALNRQITTVFCLVLVGFLGFLTLVAVGSLLLLRDT